VDHHFLEQHFPPECSRSPVQDDLNRGRRKAKNVESVGQKLPQAPEDALIFLAVAWA
jgi:hypothetical protein